MTALCPQMLDPFLIVNMPKVSYFKKKCYSHSLPGDMLFSLKIRTDFIPHEIFTWAPLIGCKLAEIKQKKRLTLLHHLGCDGTWDFDEIRCQRHIQVPGLHFGWLCPSWRGGSSSSGDALPAPVFSFCVDCWWSSLHQAWSVSFLQHRVQTSVVQSSKINQNCSQGFFFFLPVLSVLFGKE